MSLLFHNTHNQLTIQKYISKNRKKSLAQIKPQDNISFFMLTTCSFLTLLTVLNSIVNIRTYDNRCWCVRHCCCFHHHPQKISIPGACNPHYWCLCHLRCFARHHQMIWILGACDPCSCCLCHDQKIWILGACDPK